MKLPIKHILTLAALLLFGTLRAQETPGTPGEVLSFEEYLGYVKKYHPLLKSANLEISKAQAMLMQARGGFDPKIEVDFDEKQFRDREYYSILNSSFKIPTWYGIEIKAAFDNSEGYYLNPQNTVPNAGLTSLGVTVPLGQGLFINQRMADVRTAKLQQQLSVAERRLKAISVLYDAAAAYFNWVKSYREAQMYTDYLRYAETRLVGIKGLINEGAAPAIDSVESGIAVKSRKLSMIDANLKLTKARLELSNYLWINDVPVEVAEGLKPETELSATIDDSLKTNLLATTDSLVTNHPKLQSLETKISMLDVERKLKANMLLPKLNVGYHYISEPSYIDDFRFEDYKFAVNFAFPIFLRKERGAVKLAKLKIQDTQFQLDQERLQLKNKIDAQRTEISSVTEQREVISSLVKDYETMLKSEERLFSYGESSFFLINTRENNLINARLQQISLENRFFFSKADLFKILANPE
ncbi:transporter [Flavobacterium akiainvivens]|uniref:Transporter n=1 Tax=Flavobacterium akiainvivens TaxID=1202724 RepID=A0A0M8MGD8_9FLAO|nr:TolC family protein [Flavobacterium akiainvivens]KOS08324.1 transporter [Flavobacterium akiainvivens]SFQ10344.1 Outer membrane protein TolC [Flavobacterium akiainvivens]